eukprot:m.108826 g.108826  ORF g.108826 m.108826 type:complete len:756 (+) comp37326_c0_seq12:857-3124(+)
MYSAPKPKSSTFPRPREPFSYTAPPHPSSLLEASAKLKILMKEVGDQLALDRRQSDFKRHAENHFRRNSLEQFLCQTDGVLSATKLLNVVLTLPAWNDDKKAALIEDISRDMKYDKLTNKLAEFRTSLASASVDRQHDALDWFDRQEDDLKKAFHMIGQQIGDEWGLLLSHLRIPPSVITDYKEKAMPIALRCVNGLTMWMQRSGGGATLEPVLRLLKVLERQDIIDRICSAFPGLDCGGVSHHLRNQSSSSQTFPRRSSPKVTTPDAFQLESDKILQPPKLRPSGRSNIMAKLPLCEAIKNDNPDQKFPLPTRPSETSKAKSDFLRRDKEKSHKSSPEKVFPSSVASHAATGFNIKSSVSRLQLLSSPIPASGSPVALGTKKALLPPTSRPKVPGMSPTDDSHYRGILLEMADSDLLKEKNRHIQIIGVGQTGTGKTMTINRALGTITTMGNGGAVGRPGGSSATDDVRTYTRQLQREQLFQLSYTDTPGFGDSRNKFTDDQICSALKSAICDNAEVLVLYFGRADEGQNQIHITLITKVQKALGRNIDCVVLTNAATKPRLPGSWEQYAPQIQMAWNGSELREEFLEEMTRKGQPVDGEMFTDFANSSSWPEPSQQRILRLFFRHIRHHEKTQWFRDNLNNKSLPVLKLENVPKDQSDRFGIGAFYAGLAEMLPYPSRTTLSLLTSEQTVKVLPLLVTVSPILGGNRSEFNVEHPRDDTSPGTKQARESSVKRICHAILNWFKGLGKKKSLVY